MTIRTVRADITIAVLAKAPIAGLSKTRLIPALGAQGAAALQMRMIEHTVQAAQMVARVTMWVTPDALHPIFRAVAPSMTVRQQPDGDLGARMATAVDAANGPLLVIGTDCPTLTAERLHDAADALAHCDVVLAPAEDGGYGLIGMKRLHRELFADMTWSVASVMQDTRQRLAALGLTWRELATVWDVDTPEDVARLRQSEFAHLLSGEPQQ